MERKTLERYLSVMSATCVNTMIFSIAKSPIDSNFSQQTCAIASENGVDHLVGSKQIHPAGQAASTRMNSLKNFNDSARSRVNWVPDVVAGMGVGVVAGLPLSGFPGTAATFIAGAVNSPLGVMTAFGVGYGVGMATMALGGAGLGARHAFKRHEKEMHREAELGQTGTESKQETRENRQEHIVTPLSEKESAWTESTRTSLDLADAKTLGNEGMNESFSGNTHIEERARENAPITADAFPPVSAGPLWPQVPQRAPELQASDQEDKQKSDRVASWAPTGLCSAG